MLAEVYLIGNLVKDVETRDTKSGNRKYAIVKLATNGVHAGEKVTDYYDCTWFDYNEKVIQFLTKGKPIIVVGTLHTTANVGRDGKAYVYNNVNVQSVNFLDVNRNGEEGQNAGNVNKPAGDVSRAVEEATMNLPTQDAPFVDEPDNNDLPF